MLNTFNTIEMQGFLEWLAEACKATPHSLAIIDDAWKTHLRNMDELKQSVQLAVHEQKDPLLIYKFEAVELFQQFLKKVNTETVGFLMKANVVEMRFQQAAPPTRSDKPKLSTNRTDDGSGESGPAMLTPAKSQKVANRNDRVNVQYRNGTVKRDVKFKNVENDVLSGDAVLVD